jgi:hypothetical protein
MFILTITQMFLSMFVLSVSPDYVVTVYDNEIFVCPMIDHCDDDTCIDTYQMIDVQTCFNCSTENNPYSDFCDSAISFDYREYVNFTFAYTTDNITTNLYKIVYTNQFSFDDYIEFMSVFAADCLELREPETCNDALYLSANIDQKIALLK